MKLKQAFPVWNKQNDNKRETLAQAAVKRTVGIMSLIGSPIPVYANKLFCRTGAMRTRC